MCTNMPTDMPECIRDKNKVETDRQTERHRVRQTNKDTETETKIHNSSSSALPSYISGVPHLG